MISLVKWGLIAGLLLPGLALAQPAGFPPVTFEGWTVEHAVTRTPGGDCQAMNEGTPGETQLAYAGAVGGRESILLFNPALNVREGDRRTVQFRIGDFSTSLDMQFSAPGLLAYERPTPTPAAFSEFLRRSMFGRLERRNIVITIPNFGVAQILSAGAPIQDAYLRCVAYSQTERARGR